MAVFRIGGVDRKIRPLNFHWMDNAWPALQQIMNEAPPPERPADDDTAALAAWQVEVDEYNRVMFGQSIDAILHVVAEGLDQERELTMIEAEELGTPITPTPPPAPTKERLRKLLRPDEMQLVHEPIFELLRESGMRTGSGEPKPAGETEAAADASTVTSTG